MENTSTYGRPLLRALFTQAIVLAIAICGDPPELFMPAAVYTSIGFWVGTMIILIRRSVAPTQGDLDYINWGLLVIGLFGSVLAMGYWCAFRGAVG